jgi:hypothetical protein
MKSLPDSCSWFMYWEGSCVSTSMLPFETIFFFFQKDHYFDVQCELLFMFSSIDQSNPMAKYQQLI